MSKQAPHSTLPVIAIGASAGGVEACKALFKDMNSEMHAAFILIMHLDPDHESMMVDLLRDHTGLKVVLAADGMELQSGVLHIIPPGVFLTVENHFIHLSKPDESPAVRLPFDLLLRSLAKDVGASSACVVLSGTGTDGTLGIADISAAGGLVIAQDPKEAGHSGMPESAIRSGHVSRVLHTNQVAAALGEFLKAAPIHHVRRADKLHNEEEHASLADDSIKNDYDELLSFLGEFTVQDISRYKRGTLERRIAHRMSLLNLRTNEKSHYVKILRSDGEELKKLLADLLIHVTSFFRDPAVFEHLLTKAIPDLLADLPDDRPLRIWVAGCSTGEEAYSIAITCLEAMEAAGSQARLQIFASDVDPEAVKTARAGVYSNDIESAISKERLARFFVPEPDGWRVTSALRDPIVFAVADLLSDPPFSNIDLVSCRNVLIYLGAEAQQVVIASCRFALRPSGLLLLGAAETPGQSDKFFVSQDQNARLWRRVGRSMHSDQQFAIEQLKEVARFPNRTSEKRNALADMCRNVVNEHYAPAAILLNSQLECLYFLGPTEKFLKITEGRPDHGILGMLPKALRPKFRSAASSCTPQNPLVTLSGWRISTSNEFEIALHAVSLGKEHLVLACFLRSPHATTVANASTEVEAHRSADIEADLETTRRNLQEALHDLEQEIESHREDAAEALSRNEEFQSVNEELLASKEELQSLNEELTVLNNQLQETLEQHRTTANDLQNVLYSTDVATLFLDLDLNIRFFTPAARKIFHVISTDIGRPLSDLAAGARDDNLTADTHAVLATSDSIEREIGCSDERWFLRRIQPYRTDDGRLEGVVITYVDITERVRTNNALVKAMAAADRANKAKSRFLATASHDLRQPLQSMALLHKLLAETKIQSEGARLAALLDQTLSSMTAMLDSMLSVNRIESGIVRPDTRSVAINPLMQRMVEEFGPQCSLKGLKLRSVNSSAWVRTDSQLLEQMLRNLLSNALKYTKKGGVLLGCRQKGQTLSILVCDSGIGIAEKDTKAIFDAYHQAKKDSELSEHGLGLGLSIVKQLSELMQHPISVRSTPGKGSCFVIELPVAEEAPEDLTPMQKQPTNTQKTRPIGNILLVEDEEPLRNLLAQLLENEGHTVIAKANAGEALAWAGGKEAHPDLLLTDFELDGGTSGLSLAKRLPETLGNTIPTIILTGNITTSTMKSIAGSPYRQVMKPVKPEALLDMISDLMLAARKGQTELSKGGDATSTTVHVVDDDPMLRETMRHLFQAEGWAVAPYASAEEFLAEPRSTENACLLVDQLLPGMDGVALITRLRDQKSEMPAVMLTAHGDAATAVAAMKAGASDLIEKPASAADLLASVRHAIDMEASVHTRTASHEAAQKPFADLTRREREVLGRVLAGHPNKIIAFDLGINQRTVENHRASVMSKTGAASLPTLVRLAIAAGIQSA